jgi:hypothetical protein
VQRPGRTAERAGIGAPVGPRRRARRESRPAQSQSRARSQPQAMAGRWPSGQTTAAPAPESPVVDGELGQSPWTEAKLRAPQYPASSSIRPVRASPRSPRPGHNRAGASRQPGLAKPKKLKGPERNRVAALLHTQRAGVPRFHRISPRVETLPSVGARGCVAFCPAITKLGTVWQC